MLLAIMSTLFISDLHLSPKQPGIARLFHYFLQHQAKSAEALYILGDLFETWIGDDNLTPFNATIITALAKLTRSGVAIYFMPGNRDFLIGRQFIQQTGCRYLKDPSIIDLYGTATLLTHGDRFCRLDKNYMRFRCWSRNPVLQTIFLKLPLRWRQKLADHLRATEHTTTKENASRYDVVMEELYHSLKKTNTELIIHGHTHLPCIQIVKHHQQLIKRFVLSDWQATQGNMLVVLPNQTFELIYFS